MSRKENKPKPKVSKIELEEFIAGNEETEGDRNQKGGSPDDVPEVRFMNRGRTHTEDEKGS